MRSRIAAYILLLIIGCMGCAKPLAPAPIIPTIEPVPENVKRTDLPIGWIEVAQQDWSYGIPSDFNEVILNIAPMAVIKHYSAPRDITITFITHTSDLELHEYVLNNYIVARNNVISIKENTTGARTIVAIQSVEGTQSSLDFFMQKGTTIYHMSCYGETLTLKFNAMTCFSVVDTLQVK